MNIYVSSVALAGQDPLPAITEAEQRNISLEFSSGLPPDEAILKAFLDYRGNKLAHNYFPAPKDPFVINLGSFDEGIRLRSIQHCRQGLSLSAKAGAPFFAAHAGFSIDPDPTQLGRPLQLPDVLPDLARCEELFLNAVEELLDDADRLNVDFYIENNVIAAFNLIGGADNPLLGCTSSSMLKWSEKFADRRFGILLDTAHLKVSTKSLKLDLQEETRNILACVNALHHSDNDGLVDNNQPIEEDYWFAPFIPETNHLPHVLEVKGLSWQQIECQTKLISTFNQ